MFKRILIVAFLAAVLMACDNATPTQPPTATIEKLQPATSIVTFSPTPKPPPTQTPTQTPTSKPNSTDTVTPSPTYTPLPVIYGPNNFPADIDPLTGLKVSDPNILVRRPIAIKVNVVPRSSNRPAWGLSLADIVFDYYHNDGYSRFHAIFYGQNADLVGPIRSGRLLDVDLIRMYQSIFAYGSADAKINLRLLYSEFSNRVVLEGQRANCPPTDVLPLCRYDPGGKDLLLGSTAALSKFISAKGVDNGRQNLDGMLFAADIPKGGSLGTQVYVRYSGDNYTRWDYDKVSGKYLRFQDNIFDTGNGEDYAPLTDRLNDKQITADTVVVIIARHENIQQPPNEIVEILLSGSGKAYAFRDGQIFEVSWNRATNNSVLSLTYPDGTSFPFKPGNTWFQVVGETSQITQPSAGVWRYNFRLP